MEQIIGYTWVTLLH